MRLWHWFVGAPFVSWTESIQRLKSETPLRLPAIKPLKAVKAGKKKARTRNVADFRKTHR